MLLLVGGLVATAGLTSLYLRAFRRASRPLTGNQESPLPIRGPLSVLARIVVAELIVLTGLCVIVTGSLAHAIGDVAGISDDAVVSWDIVKWPLLLEMAFVAFASLQRSAFSDPRVLASSSVTSSQVVAALAWAFATTGFALYLASYKTFENTYGTIGSVIVLLVWLTMFTMLYYVTPDLRLSGIAALGAGAALSTVTWLAVNGGAGRTRRQPRLARRGARRARHRRRLPRSAVDLQRRGAARRAPERARGLWPDAAPAVDRPRRQPGAPTAASAPATRIFVRVVSRALQNDVAHDGMLSPRRRRRGGDGAHVGPRAGPRRLGLHLRRGLGGGEGTGPARERRLGRRARAGCGAGGVPPVLRQDGWEEQHPPPDRAAQAAGVWSPTASRSAAGNGHGGYELLR